MYPKIEGEALAALKVCWLQRIRDFAQQGRLLAVTDLRWVLPRWREWADPSEAREWVSSVLSDPKHALAFVRLHVNEATAQTVGSHFVQDKGWLSWKTLEQFQPKERWEQVTKAFTKVDGLSDDEQRTQKLLLAAMERWQKGVDDSNPRDVERYEEG